MRAYTIRELDDLRRCVRDHCLWGRYSGPAPRRLPDGTFGVTWGRSYRANELAVEVEEMVRTHMLAGHTAEDLLNSEREWTNRSQEHNRNISLAP